MDKTEFLKVAKAKYKNQLEVENKWVSEMNFIYSDELILRVWFDTIVQRQILASKTAKKYVETAYGHRWCKVEKLA